MSFIYYGYTSVISNITSLNEILFLLYKKKKIDLFKHNYNSCMNNEQFKWLMIYVVKKNYVMQQRKMHLGKDFKKNGR